MTTRRGFTLIETVFAIFVFSVGALGFAATTATVLRSLAVAGARERSARIAAARLEILRSQGCAAQSGSELKQGFQSEWTASPGAAGMSVLERVTYTTASGVRTDSYAAFLPCAR